LEIWQLILCRHARIDRNRYSRLRLAVEEVDAEKNSKKGTKS